MPASLYAAACRTLYKPLSEIETRLQELPNRSRVDVRLLRDACGSRFLSDDEVRLCCRALTAIGILLPSRDAYQLDLDALTASTGYRLGVREGLAVIGEGPTGGAVRLACSLPPSLDPRQAAAIGRETSDLTGGLIDLIASSRDHLLLASPYWDDATVEQIAPLLVRRLEAGVSVDILARSASAYSDVGRPVANLATRLSSWPEARVHTWFEQDSTDLWGSRTFHFKAAVADYGRSAYLGTANFTSGGLWSRLELGVFLTPPLAEQLYRVLASVLELATRPAR